MTNTLDDDMRPVTTSMDTQENQDNTQQPPEDIQDIYVLIIREQEEETHTQVVDSTPVTPQNVSFLPAYAIGCLYLFLIFSTLIFQLYCIINPPIATITIIPKSQTVTLSGTVQLGRVLPALTISQSQTTPATGHGHQPAEQARGYITVYNGQFQTVTIAAGTILTGLSGIHIITDEDAPIPAGSPAAGYGHTTVPAHASIFGSKGNIPPYDINTVCCATSVLAANLTSFQGGQDERTYTAVTYNDIHSISTVLKTTLAHSITGALQGQLHPSEQLHILPCSPAVTSDHQAGEEATTVKVNISQTCSAVAYNSNALETKARAFLTSQARVKLTGYSVFGNINVSVKQATVTNTPPHTVFLSFQASGTWVYALSKTSQEHIKSLIAGKTTQDTVQLLRSQLGIKRASLSFVGFGDAARVPKNTGYIHIALVVV